MIEKPKRTFALIRISTIGQSVENGGTSIPFQQKKLSIYATLNDLNLIKTITDVCSGGLETRDGIEELKTDIENGDVDVVLIWNVSRCFRSMIAFTKFYEYLKNHNVELISVSEGIRSSRKEGEMLFGIMCSIAGYEKEIITERMMSGRITKVQNGERGFGSKVPFGYKKTSDSSIVIDSVNAGIVKYIFKKYNSLLKNPKYNKNTRTRRLIKLLNARGFKFHNKPFKNWNIRDIISNEFYTGVLKYGEIITKHKYEPIISKRLFNQIRVVS